MKKMFVKTVFVVLAALAALAAASCKRPETKEAGGVSKAPEAVDYSQHETFTVWLQADPYDYYTDYSDNPVVWALNRKFNVTLKFEQPVKGSEQDALSLMFGTGEYTDMIQMVNYNGSIGQLYEDGVIVDIAEYLDYMPNYRHFLETNEGFRRMSYNDDGKILQLVGIGDPETYVGGCWGGLVYRRDILESATDGNVRFPSGNDEPKTVEDWEYMLPLFKAYFESKNAAEYAPLIIPYNGYIYFGDFLTGFGAAASDYVEDGKVKNGFYEDAFYKYLAKMREWYANGWIYKDFASRTNDMFFLPNTALTYGGAAGAWFGLLGQVGDAMSMPQYGMFFDVRAVPSPLSAADGIRDFRNFQVTDSYEFGGYSFTAKCENLPKLLSVLDYLYSEEGGYLYSGGLTKENGAAENPIYIQTGLTDGFYWYEGATLVVNPVMRDLDRNAFLGMRLPGRSYGHIQFPDALERELLLTNIWNPNPDARMKRLPSVISYTGEEEKVISANDVRLLDYINSMLPKFIMGTVPLNEQAWADFKAQLKALGVEDNLRIRQVAYDRYLKR